jgi:transketolase
MTILSPCDIAEVRSLLPQTIDIDGPVYIRLAKGGDRVVSSAGRICEIGRAVPMVGTEGPLDVLFVTCGITTQIALEAAAKMPLKVEVLHCHTVKPLDNQAILSRAARAAQVFTVEEHVATGGLGSAVAEILAESDLKVKFRRMALPDKFFSEHGSQNDIMKAHGLDAENLISLALKARG